VRNKYRSAIKKDNPAMKISMWEVLMRRTFGLMMLLSIFMAISIPDTVKSQSSGISNYAASASPTRFVVFEAFLRSTCGNSKAAAPIIDQLAQEFSGQPVVFVEYDVDHAPASRLYKFWANYTGSSVSLPIIMVDSGYQIDYGYTYFYYIYKWMVEDSLARPAQADIQAGWMRDGNKIKAYVKVKNLSDVTLSSSGNAAALHAIVYEDAHVKLTDRFVRTTVEKEIPSLSPGATAAFTLETSKLSGVTWENLHVIVLADYRPAGTTGVYDMLQAAEARQVAAPFIAQPDSFSFMVDPGDVTVSPLMVNFMGLDSIHWTSVQNGAWFTVSPSSGTITTQPTITVDKNNLSAGWQQGMVTFTSTDNLYSDQITVNAYLGAVERVYLPISVR
jgi:thiol-disulfide isomerase/thioredoxin